MSVDNLKEFFVLVLVVAIVAPLFVRKLALDILRFFYEDDYPGNYWLDYVENGEYRKSKHAFEKVVIEVYLFLDKVLLAKIKSIPILVVIFTGFFCFWVIYKILNT